MNPFTNPNLFLWVITGMFAANGIANLFARQWPMFWYCVGAVTLQLAVLSMAAKQ